MIRKLLNRFFREEKGQSLVIAAVAMVALLGLTAFTVDAGYLFFQKRNMQNTADAAALAGARELIDGDISNINSIVINYVEEHGLGSAEIENIIVDGNRVTVELKGNREIFFARIMGFGSTDVAARATAAVGSPSGMSGLRPIGLTRSVYEEAQENPDGVGFSFFQVLGPGTWGYVFFPPDTHHDSIVVEGMWSGCPHEVIVGEEIQVKRGNVPHAAAPVQYIIDNEIIVYVPIIEDWDKNPGGGHFPIEVIGFAAVQFTFQDKQGSNYVLEGRFVDTIGIGNIDPNVSYDFGIKGIVLVE